MSALFKLAKQQVVGLAESRVRSFEERMVQKLGERLPLRVAGMSAADLVNVVRDGVARAAVYRITSEKSVARLITLTQTVGKVLDIEELADVSEEKIAAKVEELCDNAAKDFFARLKIDKLAAEAAAALKRAGEGFSEKLPVGDPVAPCPKAERRRIYAFSS